MKREPINYPRVFGFALAGLALGAVAGFVVVFAVVMILPRGNFGEMQGVAALDLGLVAGAPAGALVMGVWGVWRGLKLGKRPR